MKEKTDNEDPLPRKRMGMLYPQKINFLTGNDLSENQYFCKSDNFWVKGIPLIAGFEIPINKFLVYDLSFVVFLFILSLFFSGIRAAYSAAGAMENPWERKSDTESLLPNRIQQLTLSLMQRAVTLLAVLLAARLAWIYLQNDPHNIVRWTALCCLVLWIWLDAIVRYNSARKALEFIPRIAGVTRVLVKVCKPLTQPVMKMGFAFGILTPEGSEISTERLEAKAESEEETDLLRGLANFRQTNARKAMQARLHITAFDIEANFHELMDKINKSGYSRVPVFREDLDHIEGILNVKDLLPHLHLNEHFNWQKLIRPVYFIPESKRLDDLMKDFQSRRVHMAIVVDEYGGTSGLITLEDIIEEIFGDINDEYDEDEEVNYTQVDENTYVFEGKVLINDLCRLLNLETDYFDEVRGNSESLAGLLLELFSRLPRTGEITTHKEITFKVQSADKKRIKKVRVLVS
ncbi:transporter associated domain-containing protein [Dyadobacter psychrotolerans]|uniref:CBS domain-containing protein n=1 Tax=Dyadobacter psychrotolerans TaxID=2541721 RepID=A0A4R5DDK6_9BACT|nr:transporter associated domain-containing protein [Dyadobacter psychrotolerans]TDE11922.1 CBS domain-containing protein [Dyadobacter psychrotolerans]